MNTLLPLVETVGARLIARKETIAVAESSTGGLISAALLSRGGASGYFVGGAVVYTKTARLALVGIGDADMAGIRPATPAYAALLASRVRERHGTTWGLAETGATGPKGNRYGDPAGHVVIGISGPKNLTAVLATGSTDRLANMRAFAAHALEQLGQALGP